MAQASFKGDADAGQALVRVSRVRPVRVDNGAGVRQLCLALVMVGDDQVDAQLPATGPLLLRR